MLKMLPVYLTGHMNVDGEAPERGKSAPVFIALAMTYHRLCPRSHVCSPKHVKLRMWSSLTPLCLCSQSLTRCTQLAGLHMFSVYPSCISCILTS